MAVESKLFTSNPQVRARLNQALTSDTHHIPPDSSGDHVAAIQKALSLFGKVKIDVSETDSQLYGTTTARAVAAFKKGCVPPLLNYKNEIDDIVGKKTTYELDRQMKEFEKNNLPVPPIPIGGAAEVQLGPLGPRGNIVSSYYRNCGLETIGPARGSPPRSHRIAKDSRERRIVHDDRRICRLSAMLEAGIEPIDPEFPGEYRRTRHLSMSKKIVPIPA